MEEEQSDEEGSPPQKPGVRFEATIHPAAGRGALADLSREVASFDLDRVPDPEGGVRVLIDPEQLSQLVEQGFEVRLQKALPVQPLNRSLIMDDEAATEWLEEQLGRIGREGES